LNKSRIIFPLLVEPAFFSKRLRAGNWHSVMVPFIEH
jgi:hypothetical protein